MSETRQAELARRLDAVHARIVAACAAAGRDLADVRLVVVTKTYPAADVELLAGLGVRDVGESRVQEAVAKAADCAGLPLTWHHVGQLQTNKAAAAVRYATVVHSVDRPGLVAALDRAATAAGRRVRCLVQVRLDEGAAGRAGVRPAEADAVASAIASAAGLDLGGVMAVAPLGADPRPAFARLRGVADRIRAAHPRAREISAGMSGDLEAAIEAGATLVRVGSAILGSRPAGG